MEGKIMKMLRDLIVSQVRGYKITKNRRKIKDGFRDSKTLLDYSFKNQDWRRADAALEVTCVYELLSASEYPDDQLQHLAKIIEINKRRIPLLGYNHNIQLLNVGGNK
ncbi:MAG: hypothetical protein ABIA78_03100 [archaeon]